MKITIRAAVDEVSPNDEVDITFTNDDLNNLNFVDMRIGDKEYQVPVADLWYAAEVFDRIRNNL